MMGEISAEELYIGFPEQVNALAEGGADAIVVETMTDLEEATLAVKEAKEGTGLDVIRTMTFEKNMDGGFRTIMGVSPAEMVPALSAAGADVPGSNCGNGTEGMVSVLRKLRKADPEVPFPVQANAGMPERKDGRTMFNELPEISAGFVPELIRSGACIIGGCFGTTPEHIRQIAQRIHSG